MPPPWNALIRTHHITSRKKVAKLRAAASNYNVYALLRYGGCPGIMYCQGSEAGVKDWVSTVQRLRYKDFRLERKPAEKQVDAAAGTHVRRMTEKDSGEEEGNVMRYGKLEEAESVKEFAAKMQEFGVWSWWRKGMGYSHGD